MADQIRYRAASRHDALEIMKERVLPALVKRWAMRAILALKEGPVSVTVNSALVGDAEGHETISVNMKIERIVFTAPTPVSLSR